jgi:hypothetical protein
MADSRSSRNIGGDPGSGVDRTSTARAPGWVKVFGFVALGLVLLIAVLHITGNSLGGHHAHHDHAPTQVGH